MGQDQKRPEALSEQYPDEIDLVDVFRFFYKEKKILLLGALLGGLIGFIAVKMMPVNYTAKFAVKVENQRSPNLGALEAINAALLQATSSPDTIATALNEAGKSLPEFARALETQGLSIDNLAKKLAAAKPGDRMVKLEAGISPTSFLLSVTLPNKLEGVDLPRLGVTLLNNIAKDLNADALADQAGDATTDDIPAESESVYFKELEAYTELTGKLAALEARLLSQTTDLVLRHIESQGFAGTANPQEAQFARIRFLLGLKADHKKSSDDDAKTLQKEFVSLQQQVLLAQQKIELANEANKKNGQSTVKLSFPSFVSTARASGDPTQLVPQSKKSMLGLVAGIFLGGMLSFMGILAARFFKDNWQRITANEPGNP